MASFERIYSVLERSSKNQGTSRAKNFEEEVSSSWIFERGRDEEESSSNKEDEDLLKESYEEDDCKVTKPSYKELFKISVKLVEENDRIKKHNLDLKESVKFLEERKKSLKLEITNLRNSRETCDTYVSFKKEVIDLHETLSKFTKGKENIDLILSSQKTCLNKNGLGFKRDKTHNKGLNHKKKNCTVYKGSYYNKFGNLEPFYFDTMKRYKDSNLRPSGKTNTHGPKKIWVPKVKP